jgi:hypothetical protein
MLEVDIVPRGGETPGTPDEAGSTMMGCQRVRR